MREEEIVNRVAESGLVQINLDDFLVHDAVIPFDLAMNLFQGLILREKDFRDFLRRHDWTPYAKKHVAVFCSADAIIPQWAYMLLASHLEAAGAFYHYGNPAGVVEHLLIGAIGAISTGPYIGKRVLIKGCSLENVSPAVYMEITRRLQPVVKSLMFGEACSTVPVFRKKD